MLSLPDIKLRDKTGLNKNKCKCKYPDNKQNVSNDFEQERT